MSLMPAADTARYNELANANGGQMMAIANDFFQKENMSMRDAQDQAAKIVRARAVRWAVEAIAEGKLEYSNMLEDGFYRHIFAGKDRLVVASVALRDGHFLINAEQFHGHAQPGHHIWMVGASLEKTGWPTPAQVLTALGLLEA